MPGRKLKHHLFSAPLSPLSPLSPERLSAGNHSAKLSKENALSFPVLESQISQNTAALQHWLNSLLFFFLIPDLISVALEDDRSLRSPLGVLSFKERLIKWKILLQTAGSSLRKPHSRLAVFRLFSCSHPVIFILGTFCEMFR